MTTKDADKMATVTLTDERPVRVKNGQWPVVARADDEVDHNHQQRFQREYLRVRMHDTGEDLEVFTAHADGRCLVYGWTGDDHQGAHGTQAGYRCHVDEVVAMIRKVGERIGAEQWLVDECVAALPEVEEPEEEPDIGLPAELTITIRIETRAQAEAMVNTLIAFEADLRATPSIPVAQADAVAKARRGLQARAGLAEKAKG